MFKYNLCLFRREDEILLLNRFKAPWMGCWNGIGGKTEKGETPREAMIREIHEETGIKAYTLHFKGVVTWTWNDQPHGGMYIYLADVEDTYEYSTPLATEEGLLDWKKIDWIMHPENGGIAKNIPRILEKMLNDENCYNHHCVYEGDELVKWEAFDMNPAVENAEEIQKILSTRENITSEYIH
ncbi:MAG TPA: 8-oxo-dGTP diphosphatase [Thermotogota bacterium]|nr:8-oxo-dGTP diphosphatase [Thermotogota bacterium]